MLTVFTDYRPLSAPIKGPRYIIAQPNHSASWQANKQILLVFGLFLGLVATAFTLIGAWILLPFAGIEITALGSALYISCRRSKQRHVIRFDGSQLIIEKGLRQAERRWVFDKQAVSLVVTRNQHPWDPLRIRLCNKNHDGYGELIAIGDFLNREDSKKLLALLRAQGLTVSSDSLWGNTAI